MNTTKKKEKACFIVENRKKKEAPYILIATKPQF